MTTEHEHEYFSFGDHVRSRQNPHLTGQIIGERNWGDEYFVRLADGATTIWWNEIEIEHDIPDDDDGGSNVINFTEYKAKLRVNAKTEGVA